MPITIKDQKAEKTRYLFSMGKFQLSSAGLASAGGVSHASTFSRSGPPLLSSETFLLWDLTVFSSISGLLDIVCVMVEVAMADEITPDRKIEGCLG